MKARIWACSIFALFFVVMLIAANPTGNFPLNDDWNYGWSVKNLVEQKSYLITCWTLTAAVTQVLAGAAACAVTGFSFDTLRAVTWVFSLLGVGALFLLLRKAQSSPAVALAGAALLMVNPLYFELSNTFMTDVPFIALSTLLSYFLVRAIKDGRRGDLLIATVLAVLTVLTRQVGIVIPIAFAIVNLLRKKEKNFALGFLPLASALAAIVIYQIWLASTPFDLFSYRAEHVYLRQMLAGGPIPVLLGTVINFVRAFVYLGLFAFPFVVSFIRPVLSSFDKTQRGFFLMLSAELVVLVFGGLLYGGSMMPLGDNVLFNFGLGPILVAQRIGLESWPSAPHSFWMLVTLAGVFGGSVLFSLMVLRAINLRKDWRAGAVSVNQCLALFCLLVILEYLAVECFRGFFDRYLLLPLPYLMALYAVSMRIEERITESNDNLILCSLGTLTILIFAFFSIAATHDYFEFNRTRWRALNHLTATDKVSPMSIDGGLEFNGWIGYMPEYRNNGGIVLSQDMTHGSDYLITLGRAKGYDVMRRYWFVRWLTPGIGQIFVLRKQNVPG